MPTEGLFDRSSKAGTRRDVAVLAADVFGYSRLMEVDEGETHARLTEIFVHLLPRLLVECHGELVKSIGDGFIAYFVSAQDAVEFSIAFQKRVEQLERDSATDRGIMFRIGLNFGPVIVEREDIFGNTVIIAARLEQAAPPGGILATDHVMSQLSDPLRNVGYDLGSIHLKNIAEQCRVFAIEGEGVAIERSRHGQIASVRPATPPVIAVIPFESLSPTGDEYFGRGVVDDIITGLSGLGELFVIARGSTLGFKGGPSELQRISQELRARYVVSGTIRRANSRIRINAELADLDEQTVLWADRFDGAAADLFDIQDEISSEIVGRVAPHVREAAVRKALRKRPDSLDAYDLMLLGLDRLHSDREHFVGARELLEGSMRADARFASSHAYAALWHNFNVARGWSPNPRGDANEASRLAERAIERDPNHGLALALYGHIRSFLFRDYEVARGYLDKAKIASPSGPMAWALSSASYSYVGRAGLALREAERALRLSPLDTHAFFFMMIAGIAHYAAGQFEDAVTWGYRAYGQHPQTTGNLRTLTASLVALDRMAEAQHIAALLLKQDPTFRLSHYERQCPWADNETRRVFIQRLKLAGLVE